eukprot:Lithocolla_globosa_v1_NODE_7736_length_906_cov_10.787309.p2 type:complete len:124 gc:universal NODE_7736_length_906_cov_10.787309:642-271(-)
MKHLFKLVVNSHLASPYQHSSADKGHRTPPEGQDPFLSHHTDGSIANTGIVATLFHRQRGIIGHSHKGYLSGTRHHGSHRTRRHPDQQAFGQLDLPTLGQRISHQFKAREPSAGIEELTSNAS